MKLTVVRHGETVENANDIVMGHHGGTLSEKGIEQAKMAAQTLKNEAFDQVWSSDLKRCADTAEYILELHPEVELNLTSSLREVNYGKFQGRPGAEIRAYFDKEGGFNQKSKVTGGESHLEMGARVLKFVNDLLQHNNGKKILLVTHNGPMEAIRAAIERTPFTGDSENAEIKLFDITTPLESYNS